MARMLSLDEAAERLGLSRTTVYRRVVAGEIRAHKMGRLWKVPEDAVTEYLQRTANVPQDSDQADE